MTPVDLCSGRGCAIGVAAGVSVLSGSVSELYASVAARLAN
jgi:hypothetical protein